MISIVLPRRIALMSASTSAELTCPKCQAPVRGYARGGI